PKNLPLLYGKRNIVYRRGIGISFHDVFHFNSIGSVRRNLAPAVKLRRGNPSAVDLIHFHAKLQRQVWGRDGACPESRRRAPSRRGRAPPPPPPRHFCSAACTAPLNCAADTRTSALI